MIITLLLFLDDIGGLGAFLLTLFIAVPLYFLPAIIARHKRQGVPILLLNLFLGWTFLGWIGALIWAVSKEAPVVRVTNSVSPTQMSSNSIADEIAKLRDLRDQGILTPEEFERQKNNLIS